MSRFWMVELEGGLDHSRHIGLWHAIGLHPGVRSITDMAAISAETLDAILLKPEPDAPLVVPERPQQLELV